MAAKRGTEIKVGIFMIVTFVVFILVMVTLTSKTQFLKKTYTLNTSFDNIAGLIAGAEVRLSGINIGLVESIEFTTKEGDTKVFIVITVDNNGMQRIRKDSQATIQTTGLLGKKFVEILPGTTESESAQDGDYLKSVEPVSMAEALDKGGKILDSIGTTATYLEEVIGSLSGEKGKETDIAKAITHIKNLVRDVEHGGGVLHSLIYDKEKSKIITDLVAAAENIKKITKEIESGDGTIHDLIYGIKGKELVANLSDASEIVRSVVAEVKEGRGFLHSIIYQEDKSDLILELKRTAENLREVSDKLQRGEGTLGALLVDPTIYEDIKKITGDVERSTILKAYIRYTIRKNEAAESGDEETTDGWGEREG